MCSGGVRIFNRASLEYNSYESIFRQIAVVRDAVEDMASLNNAMFISREALLKTLDSSVEVIENIVDTFDEASRHQIASSDTRFQLEDARARIEDKVNKLRASVRAQNESVIEATTVPPLQLSASTATAVAEKSPS